MRTPLWLQNLFPETVGRFSLAEAITNTLGDFYGSLEPEIDFSLKDSTANPPATAGSVNDAGVRLSSEKEDGECSSDADGEDTPLPLNRNGKHGTGVRLSSEKEDDECSSDADGEDKPLLLNTNGKRRRNTTKMFRRRLKQRANPGPTGPQLRHLRSTEAPQPTTFEATKAPHTKNAYVGTTHDAHAPDDLPDLDAPLPEGDGTIHPLIPHLQAAYGFSLRSIQPGERVAAFQSSDNSKIFLLRTRPADSGWQDLAVAAVETLYKSLRLPASASVHRRGFFFTDKYGFSHGTGRTVPGNWVTTEGRIKAWQTFLATPAILNMMNYIAVIFQTWSPRLFQFYSECRNDYLRWDPMLHMISQNLPFSSVAANFGPATVCWWHRDALNLVFGWCVVWALGNYDSKYGGHLILWEPRLIVEFAPGDIILLPSACITHANIPIRKGETRYSVTWFSAGGLFSYRAYDYRSEGEKKAQDPAGFQKHQSASEGKKRWMEGWEYFSSLDELKAFYSGGSS